LALALRPNDGLPFRFSVERLAAGDDHDLPVRIEQAGKVTAHVPSV
jgi:hypothetical protein